MSIHFGDKNVKEIRYGQKKVKEVWYGDKKVWPSAPPINLDLNNGQPIGRMDDGELWFRVWVKDPNEPFKIAANGDTGKLYDWDISIDGGDPVRKNGRSSITSISLPMSAGKHYVKITPHNGVAAGWARCLGNGGVVNYWNNNKNKLEFGLEWLPGYAFMKSETEIGDNFLVGAWQSCSSLTSIPNNFNLPQNITSVGDSFLGNTWQSCSSLTSMPNDFNLPQNITSVGKRFLYCTWYNCTSLTSMPNDFNLPQNITSAGKEFLNHTWDSCYALASMPNGFNLPQNFPHRAILFLYKTWRNCSSLTSNSPAKQMRFPDLYPVYRAEECFGGSCPITPDSPLGGSSVMVRRNS